MKFRYFQPSVPLRPYVDYFFIVENSKEEEAYPTEVFPSTQLEMTFTYGDEKSSYVEHGNGERKLAEDYSINGYFTHKSTYTNQNSLGVIMVGFKPWGLQPFLDYEVGEITNTSLDLNLINANKIRSIEDQIRTVNTDEERIKIIETFLLATLRRPELDDLIVHAVHQILQGNGQRSIRQISDEYHLCHKQFKRRFIRTVGIPPKLFSRISRFQHIINLMDNKQFKLLDIAFESGFFDQAHFINEFKQFTHETPKDYLNLRCRTELGRYFDQNSRKSLFYNSVYR